MRNKVVDFKEERPIDFDWATRPILVWMRCIGVPLLDVKSIKQTNIYVYVVVIVYTLVFYSVTVTNNLIIALTSDNNQTRPLKTSDWNNVVTLQNFVFAVIGTHTALLFTTAVKWNDLHRASRKMKQLKTKDYRQIRYTCLMGVAFLLFDLAVQTAPIFGFISIKMSAWTKLKHLMSAMSGILPTSGGILTCIYSHAACIVIQSIREDLDHCWKWTDIQLNRIKRHYGQISQFVDELDNCLGTVLLVLITSLFIRTISNTFFALVNYQESGPFDNSMTSLLYMLKELIVFSLYTSFSHQIRTETNKLGKRLRNIEGLDSTLQNQVDHLSLEVLLCPPQLTAASFFNVDLHLLPTLVGTTLTYIIILCQFQSSERPLD